MASAANDDNPPAGSFPWPSEQVAAYTREHTLEVEVRVHLLSRLALCDSPALEGPEHLNLRETRVEAKGLRALILSDKLPALQVINVMHTPDAKSMRAELRARFDRVIDLS